MPEILCPHSAVLNHRESETQRSAKTLTTKLTENTKKSKNRNSMGINAV
jgi:hypothetical protein